MVQKLNLVVPRKKRQRGNASQQRPFWRRKPGTSWLLLFWRSHHFSVHPFFVLLVLLTTSDISTLCLNRFLTFSTYLLDVFRLYTLYICIRRMQLHSSSYAYVKCTSLRHERTSRPRPPAINLNAASGSPSLISDGPTVVPSLTPSLVPGVLVEGEAASVVDLQTLIEEPLEP